MSDEETKAPERIYFYSASGNYILYSEATSLSTLPNGGIEYILKSTADKELEAAMKPLKELRAEIKENSLSVDCYSASAILLMIKTFKAIKKSIQIADNGTQ